MHLRRPPEPRASPLLWGIGLGLYVWIGLLAVGVAGGTAFLFGLLVGIGIFFLVLRLGGERYSPRPASERRAPRWPGASAVDEAGGEIRAERTLEPGQGPGTAAASCRPTASQ